MSADTLSQEVGLLLKRRRLAWPTVHAVVSLLALTAWLGLAATSGAHAQADQRTLSEERAANVERIQAIDKEAEVLAGSLQDVGRRIEAHKGRKPNPRDRAAVDAYNEKSRLLDAEHDQLVKQLDALTDEQDRLIAQNQEIDAWLKLSFRKVSPAWKKLPGGLAHLQNLDHLVGGIPDGARDPVTNKERAVGQAFKRWVADSVTIDRSPAVVAGISASPRKLPFHEAFFKNGPDRQKNLLVFELAKVLWFAVNKDDAQVAQTATARDFVDMFERRHPRAMSISELKAAPLDQQGRHNLGDLADSDLQSHFSYAVRVAILNLDPPRGASAETTRDWVNARNDMQQYLMTLLAANR